MALSVGMFQRPVEYKLNCLEMVYEFSGLRFEILEHFASGRDYLTHLPFKTTLSQSIDYFGKVELKICFTNIDGLKKIHVAPTFKVKVLSAISVYYDDADELLSQKYTRSKISRIQSHQNKIIFYETLRGWIFDRLNDDGFSLNEMSAESIKFDFSGYGIDFYLHSGSSNLAFGSNEFPFVFSGFDEDGFSIWSPIYELDYLGRVRANYTIFDGRDAFMERMVLNEPEYSVSRVDALYSETLEEIESYYDGIINYHLSIEQNN